MNYFVKQTKSLMSEILLYVLFCFRISFTNFPKRKKNRSFLTFHLTKKWKSKFENFHTSIQKILFWNRRKESEQKKLIAIN